MTRLFHKAVRLRTMVRFWKGFALSMLLVFTSVAPLAAFGNTAGSAVIAGGRIHPIRTPNGRVVRNARNQVESSNWSGYVVAGYKTGKTYTAATATWVVPSVTSAPGFSKSYSSSWLGIGGFLLNSKGNRTDNTLIQLGTEQDASLTGTAKYYAWYETLPNPQTRISSLPINPGDTVQATLLESPAVSGTKIHGHHSSGGGGGSGQTWTLTMTVTDPAGGTQSWSTTLAYKSSLASAEWIEEAPYSGGVLPLADFNTVTFDPGTVDGANPGLTAKNGVIMVDPKGQTSNISGPDSDTDGFSAAWGAGTTLTAVSPPAS